MILSHFDLEKPLELTPAVVNVLVVENENKFFDFCKEFALQSKGNSGNFVLFDGDTKLSLVKDVKLLYDFFNLPKTTLPSSIRNLLRRFMLFLKN